MDNLFFKIKVFCNFVTSLFEKYLVATMKKNINIKKEVFVGILIGFIATAIGFYFYTQVFNDFSLKFVKKLITEYDYLGEILIYSVSPNLIAFFVFIKRKEDYRARGVILTTMLVALAVAASLFI